MTIPRSFHQHDVSYPKLARFMEAKIKHSCYTAKTSSTKNLNEAIYFN